METTDTPNEDADIADWAKTLLVSPEPAPSETTEIPEEEEEEPEQEEAQAEPETEDEPEAEEPPTPEEPLYTIKIDGEEQQVTLEELKRRASGTGKIQKSMQEAAEERKRAEAAFHAFQAETQRVLQLAQTLQTQGFVQPPKLPDPALAEKDPVRYIKEQAKYQQDAQKYMEQQAQINATRQQYERAQQAAMQAQVAQQQAELARAIPEWSDPEKGNQLRGKLYNVAVKDYGYTQQELDNVFDARAVRVLNDAAKWRELQARTAEAKKSPDAPRTVKPAAKRPEPPQLAQSKLIEKAKKTQSVDDWTKWLLVPKT